MVYKVFRRPSIDLDAKRKTWEYRPADTIAVGSTVADMGQVVGVSAQSQGDKYTVTLSYVSGKTETLPHDTLLYSYQ